jgi:hypothetical protein
MRNRLSSAAASANSQHARSSFESAAEERDQTRNGRHGAGGEEGDIAVWRDGLSTFRYDANVVKIEFVGRGINEAGLLLDRFDE